MFSADGRWERVNLSLPIARPAEPNRVERIPFGRKTKVVGCIARRVGIVKRAGRYLGWTFTIDPPRPSAVDRLPIHIQPRADIKKNLLYFLRDCAVRAWTDVQQQIAIFADDIYELMHYELRRFEGVVFNVPPGFVTYRGVGLPIEGTDIAKLSALHVEHSRVFLHGIVLIIDYSDVVTVLQRTVVVKGGELGETWPYQSLSDPPIEVDNVG